MDTLEQYNTLNPLLDDADMKDWMNGYYQWRETNNTNANTAAVSSTANTTAVASAAIPTRASTLSKPKKKKIQATLLKYFPSSKSKPEKYADESEHASKRMTPNAPCKKVSTPSSQEPTCQEHLTHLKTVRNEPIALADLFMIRLLLDEITDEANLRECVVLLSETVVDLQIHGLPDIAHDLALSAPDLTLSFSRLALYLARCNAPRLEMKYILNKIEDHEKRDIVCLAFLRALICIKGPSFWDTQDICKLLTSRKARISALFFLRTPHVFWNTLRPGLNFSIY